MTNPWRLWSEAAPRPGAWNMAADEFLFRALPDAPRTIVRFYRWARPTASLGFGQDAARAVDLEFCRRRGIDVVRRLTGGKLVLHHDEVTYSVCSSDAAAFTPTLSGSYRLISQGLVRGLEGLGLAPSLAPEAPPGYARGTVPCFSRPARDEIEVGGRKIVGSAQKRIRTKFLQHGSIPLTHDEALLKAVSGWGEPASEIRMTSLAEALGRPIGFEEVAGRLAAGLAEAFGIRFEPLVLSESDRAGIERLAEGKYATDAWTLRGETAPLSAGA